MKRLRGMVVATYCGAGALCVPPLKRPGMSVYIDSVEAGKAKVAAPEVPAAEEMLSGLANCQHSSWECFWAFVTSAVAWR